MKIDLSNIRIFDLDYLINAELDESDLYYIYETPSLIYSIMVNMFHENGYNMNNEDIIQLCKKDNNWMYGKYWIDKHHRNDFIKRLTKAFMNIYQISENNARQNVEMIMFSYGLSMKNNNLHE